MGAAASAAAAADFTSHPKALLPGVKEAPGGPKKLAVLGCSSCHATLRKINDYNYNHHAYFARQKFVAQEENPVRSGRRSPLAYDA